MKLLQQHEILTIGKLCRKSCNLESLVGPKLRLFFAMAQLQQRRQQKGSIFEGGMRGEKMIFKAKFAGDSAVAPTIGFVNVIASVGCWMRERGANRKPEFHAQPHFCFWVFHRVGQISHEAFNESLTSNSYRSWGTIFTQPLFIRLLDSNVLYLTFEAKAPLVGEWMD